MEKVSRRFEISKTNDWS